MAITAQMVKELREKTGAGMMDCKKALTETNGDMEKAIDFLREKGIAKAAKKADRIAAEGLTFIETNGNDGLILELNSETDFVAKNEGFQTLIKELAAHLLAKKPANVEEAMAQTMETVKKLKSTSTKQSLKLVKSLHFVVSKSYQKLMQMHSVLTYTWVDALVF